MPQASRSLPLFACCFKAPTTLKPVPDTRISRQNLPCLPTMSEHRDTTIPSNRILATLKPQAPNTLKPQNPQTHKNTPKDRRNTQKPPKPPKKTKTPKPPKKTQHTPKTPQKHAPSPGSPRESEGRRPWTGDRRGVG